MQLKEQLAKANCSLKKNVKKEVQNSSVFIVWTRFMDLFKGGWIMCTYWENAVKEFFKKQEQEQERNKRAASKS